MGKDDAVEESGGHVDEAIKGPDQDDAEGDFKRGSCQHVDDPKLLQPTDQDLRRQLQPEKQDEGPKRFPGRLQDKLLIGRPFFRDGAEQNATKDGLQQVFEKQAQDDDHQGEDDSPKHKSWCDFMLPKTLHSRSDQGREGWSDLRQKTEAGTGRL